MRSLSEVIALHSSRFGRKEADDVWFEKNSKRCKGGKLDVGKFEKCDVCNI